MKKLKNIVISFLFILSFINFQALALGENNKKPVCFDNVYEIESKLDSSMVIDLDGGRTDDGANIQLYKRNSSLAQRFCILCGKNGYYTIKSVASGKMIDVEGAGKSNGTNVWQYSENNTDAQKWKLISDGDGYYYIQSKVNGLYLDVSGAKVDNGTNIQVYEGNCSDAQKFKLKKVNPKEFGLSSEEKKEWSTRLKWMEKDIMSNFKDGQNILVVGNKNFIDAFKGSKYKKKSAKYTYAYNLNNFNDLNMFDLIIDTKYRKEAYKILNYSGKIVSFRDVYRKVLANNAIEYLKSNNIPIYFFENPVAWKIKNADSFERSLIRGKVKLNKENLDKIYGGNEECRSFYGSKDFKGISQLADKGNHIMLLDYAGKNANVVRGRRLTVGVPANSQNTIHVYGSCTVKGRYVTDGYTIPSFLQRLAKNDFGRKYSVENCGLESDEINDFEYIINTKFKSGDIVIVEREISSDLKKIIDKYSCNYYELSSLFNRPHEFGYWMVESPSHINQVGNEVIANYIYKVIKNDLKDAHWGTKKEIIYPFENQIDAFLVRYPEFEDYLENLKKASSKIGTKGKKIGTLNVNCNPFTLGHRYLIEEALKKVDHLYLFVVEEDASNFPFADRYEMVKRGVADLKNITVLKTGKWMCSMITFPDYFDKDNLQNKVLDPTMDIELYGKYIAPALGATVRFTGTEPLDKITMQHNNFMKMQLPSYGITFYEIERKLLDSGEVISASAVRRLYKKGNFGELKKYVPMTTYDYLLKNYHRLKNKM